MTVMRTPLKLLLAVLLLAGTIVLEVLGAAVAVSLVGDSVVEVVLDSVVDADSVAVEVALAAVAGARVLCVPTGAGA